MYSGELWISAHVCFLGGGRKLYLFRVFQTKLLRSALCVLRGRAPSLIRVLGATQARYYLDRSSRRRELGVVGAAESFIQLDRQRCSTASRVTT